MEEKKPIVLLPLSKWDNLQKEACRQIKEREMNELTSIESKCEEERVTLTEMFEFTGWKESQDLMYDNLTKTWHTFEVSQWVLIGNDSDLWKKYKERNK